MAHTCASVAHMSSNHLGTVVSSEMAARGISENQASFDTGISRQTLRRRIASGEFTVRELHAVARILDTTAADLLQRTEGAVA